MTTQNNNSDPNAPQGDGGNPQTPATPPSVPPASSEPPAQQTPTVEELIADRDKWKALSRQNENNYNATRTELQKLKEAQQAAVEAAKNEGRTSALGEVAQELVTAELRLQAAMSGAQLPDLQFLDLDRFKGEDAKPNAEAIKAFIESLPKSGGGQSSSSGFPPLQGAGHNRSGGNSTASMDPNELADYISGGSFL